MLDTEILAGDFTNHVASCPSGRVACSVGVAVESWFHVELAHLLLSSGQFESVRFSYDYPGTRQKADLAVTSEQGLVVLEFKCFVQGADSNKILRWPRQLQRLVELVEKGDAAQGVALSTFYGYPKDRVIEFVRRFHPSPWTHSRPRKFLASAPLELVVATAGRYVREPKL